jgi:hypothetical protein
MILFVQTCNNHCQDKFFTFLSVSIQKTAAVSIINHINSGSRKIDLLCLHRPAGEVARGNQKAALRQVVWMKK